VRENYLLQLALEMLETTNPYKKPLQGFCYSYVETRERYNVNFLDLLEKELQGKHKSFRKQNPLERDYLVCYIAIANTMVKYIEDYQPQSYAFLQETKLKFSKWLVCIAETYSVSEQIEPDLLKVNPNDCDTAITLLKALHPRKRVTVKEISEQMGIKERAVQKGLKKLDPTWNSDTEDMQDPPFRIGGRPVEVKINAKQPETGKATLYRTTNTVHPLVLLENQMQVGTLLKSLAHTYCVEHSYISYSIGLDIWYQLSEYSRERVKNFYASNDENLQDFLEDLEFAIPNKATYGFETERSLVTRLGSSSLSNEEILAFAAKGPGRPCNLILKTPEGGTVEMACCKIQWKRTDNDKLAYIATDLEGNQIEINKEDIEEIVILEDRAH